MLKEFYGTIRYKRLCFVALLVFVAFEIDKLLGKYLLNSQEAEDPTLKNFIENFNQIEKENEEDIMPVLKPYHGASTQLHALRLCLKILRTLPVLNEEVHLIEFKKWLLNHARNFEGCPLMFCIIRHFVVMVYLDPIKMQMV